MMYVELIRQTSDSPAVSLSSARLFDHLTPKMQNLYSEAKKFKASHGYEYCWAKNWFVYLRKDADSRALKKIWSLSNHDDDENKNVTNLHI